jgi:hypothetical protein
MRSRATYTPPRAGDTTGWRSGTRLATAHAAARGSSVTSAPLGEQRGSRGRRTLD